MTLVQHTYDDQPSGTVATTTNTGGSAVNALSGGAVTFASSMAARGTQCGIKMVATGAGSAADLRYAIPANAKCALTAVVTIPAATPTASAPLFYLWAGGARAVSVTCSTANKIVLTDSATAVISPNVALTPGTRYRIGLVIDNSGGTAAGKATLNVYTETGTTPLATASTTTLNFTATPFDQLRLGATAWPAEGATIGFDDVQRDDGQTVEIAPIVTAPPATVPPTDVINDRALYVIDRTGSSSTGGSTTYAITQTAGTTTTPTLLTTGMWGVVQPTTGTLTYKVTLTTVGGANDGATATDTVTVPTAASGGTTNVSAPLQWNPGTSTWV